jgi:3,4-dihydroxy 2-butanone 4-phosphate synthase/GTP cyclohydrolase II
MKRIAEEKRGVIVYLREGSVGVGRDDDRNRATLQDREAHAEAKVREEEWRQIGLGAQILKDLGITSIRLLSSRERHYVGLEGFGIQITKTDIL